MSVTVEFSDPDEQFNDPEAIGLFGIVRQPEPLLGSFLSAEDAEFQARVGVPGSLRWVPADRLRIEAYQRDLREPKVRKIVKKFKPKIFGVLAVSERFDGSLYVIDGQHRLEALKRLGLQNRSVPCMVYRGLTVKDEADIFAETQSKENRTEISPRDMWRADLLRGDSITLAAKDAVERAGFRIDANDKSNHRGNILGIGTVMQLARDGREGDLEEILTLLRDAWGNEEGPPAVVIGGVARYIARYRGLYDRKRLVDVLSNFRPGLLVNDGKRQQTLNGISHYEGVGRAISVAYNDRLRSRRLPTWEEAAHNSGRGSKMA